MKTAFIILAITASISMQAQKNFFSPKGKTIYCVKVSDSEIASENKTSFTRSLPYLFKWSFASDGKNITTENKGAEIINHGTYEFVSAAQTITITISGVKTVYSITAAADGCITLKNKGKTTYYCFYE